MVKRPGFIKDGEENMLFADNPLIQPERRYVDHTPQKRVRRDSELKNDLARFKAQINDALRNDPKNDTLLSVKESLEYVTGRLNIRGTSLNDVSGVGYLY
jgi:hypothetical protein